MARGVPGASTIQSIVRGRAIRRVRMRHYGTLEPAGRSTGTRSRPGGAARPIEASGGTRPLEERDDLRRSVVAPIPRLNRPAWLPEDRLGRRRRSPMPGGFGVAVEDHDRDRRDGHVRRPPTSGARYLYARPHATAASAIGNTKNLPRHGIPGDVEGEHDDERNGVRAQAPEAGARCRSRAREHEDDAADDEHRSERAEPGRGRVGERRQAERVRARRRGCISPDDSPRALPQTRRGRLRSTRSRTRRRAATIALATAERLQVARRPCSPRRAPATTSRAPTRRSDADVSRTVAAPGSSIGCDDQLVAPGHDATRAADLRSARSLRSCRRRGPASVRSSTRTRSHRAGMPRTTIASCSTNRRRRATRTTAR